MEGLFVVVLLVAGAIYFLRGRAATSYSRHRRRRQNTFVTTGEQTIGAGRVIVTPPPNAKPEPPAAWGSRPIEHDPPMRTVHRPFAGDSVPTPLGARQERAMRADGLKANSPGVRLNEFNDRLQDQPAPTDRPLPTRDLDYEQTEGVREVLSALADGASAVLVYGGAGVGKSHLVRYLRSQPGGESTVVVAPTAIAALTSGGQTIHSFFQFPPRVLDRTHLETLRNPPQQVWRRMTRLIVDEISMVRPDLLDSMDARLKQVRGSGRAFGGVQLVLVGDPLQLPPVVTRDERPLLHAMGYKTPFLHSAKVWEHVDGMRAVELTRVFRQTEPDFIHALNDLRRGRDLVAVTEFLNERCFRPHRESANPILLTPTKQAADQYNAEGLAALPGPDTLYIGKATAGFVVQEDKVPVPETLRLKVGAEVMTVTNDVSRRWVNGSRGKVVELKPDAALVRFYGTGEAHLVERHTWEKIKQTWDGAAEQIRNEPKGSYTQLPLIPGWALTIHKAQGMSLDDVRVDLGHGTFASGQLYVAVSRAKSLAGLSLARPLNPGNVMADTHLLTFMDWLDCQKELYGV